MEAAKECLIMSQQSVNWLWILRRAPNAINAGKRQYIVCACERLAKLSPQMPAFIPYFLDDTYNVLSCLFHNVDRITNASLW